MRSTQPLSITLPHEMAQMVKAKVSSGEYATESEVIRDGLRALQARDAAIEKWLVEEVVPTAKAIQAGTVKTVPIEEVRQRLHAYIDSKSRSPRSENEVSDILQPGSRT